VPASFLSKAYKTIAPALARNGGKVFAQTVENRGPIARG